MSCPIAAHSETERAAVVAAIRCAVAHAGASAAAVTIVDELLGYGLKVSVAEVDAVKAEKPCPAAKSPPVLPPEADVRNVQSWREQDHTSAPTLVVASRLLESTGSVELAKHTLDVATELADQQCVDATSSDPTNEGSRPGATRRLPSTSWAAPG